MGPLGKIQEIQVRFAFDAVRVQVPFIKISRDFWKELSDDFFKQTLYLG